MKKVFALLLIVAGLGAVGYYQWPKFNQKPHDDSLVLYGNVDIREVRLAFDGSEHVENIVVDEGDRVESGQLLAQLHNHRLKAEYDKVSAEVTAAEAQASLASTSYQRVKRLAARNLASKDDADVADAKRKVADANVESAKASLREIELSLNDTKLYAPAAGVIRDRIVQPGDFVTPQTPVLTLALDNPIWIRTYLPETSLGKVKPGMAAEVRTDSFPAKVYQGWVGAISPTAEFTPKTVETPELRTRLVYQVRVFVCNPQNELRLGMPATVTLHTDAVGTGEPVDSSCRQPEGEAPAGSVHHDNSTGI